MKRTFCLVVFVLVLGSTAGLCHAQPEPQLSQQEQSSLKSFLRSYVSNSGYDYSTTRYVAAPARLESNAEDIIVYFTDRNSCGSSGCTTLILAPQGSSYKVITSISAARLPIRVLNTMTNGWHDVAVWVQGGGIEPGYEAVLSFDGTTYPMNPSVPPARKLNHAEGRVLIHRDEQGEFLF